MPNPNVTGTTLDEAEGVVEEEEAISIGLSEERINKIIGDRVDKGKSF